MQFTQQRRQCTVKVYTLGDRIDCSIPIILRHNKKPQLAPTPHVDLSIIATLNFLDSIEARKLRYLPGATRCAEFSRKAEAT